MVRIKGAYCVNTIFKSMAVASVALALAACGNFSHQVAKDGRSAGELAWPSPESTTPMHKGGTFPSTANLRQVKAGLNKQQVADLIGYPHFHEGVWRVREWNYLFNFRQPDTDAVTVCQFKVLFDDQKRAQGFYWSPQPCSAVLDASPVAAAGADEPRVFSADALFGFDSDDLSGTGQRELEQLATELQQRKEPPESVRILGHTDRLGSESYNRSLSQRRAQAVKDYLVARGLPRDVLTAVGVGEAAPSVECADQPREALVACLAPNRRVEVIVL